MNTPGTGSTEPPREVTVTVTADDIRHGERTSCQRCAIARAVNRIPGFSGASVGSDDFAIDLDDGRYAEYRLPPDATAFVRALDDPDPAARPRPVTFTATLREGM
jgi:hypothetical protein